MKVSKRDREMAARICSAAACEDTRHLSDYWSVTESLGIDSASPASCLAFAAFDEASRRAAMVGEEPWSWDPCLDGEAEALIRTGWSPE